MRSAELSGSVKRGGPIALEQSVSYTVDCGHVSLAPLSANITETPAPLGITVGWWR